MTKTKIIQYIPALLALAAVGLNYISLWCIFTTRFCYGTTISHISLTITQPLYFFALYLLPLTIVLIFIPRSTFISWLKLAAWAIPLSIIYIWTTPVNFTGIGIDFFPFYRDDAARLAAEVFTVVSFLLIAWKWFRSRKNI